MSGLPPPSPPGPPPPPPPPPPFPPDHQETLRDTYLSTSLWTFGRIAAILGAWVFAGILGATVAAVLGYDPAATAAGFAITVVAQTAGALIAVIAFSRAVGTGSLRADIGLTMRWSDTKWIFGGLALQIAVAVVISPLVQILFDHPDAQQQVADLAESTTDSGGQIVLLVLFVLVAPVAEEVIFRGAMLSWLAGHLAMRWAVVVSAAAFAAVHLMDPGAYVAVPGLFLIGLGLGWAAQRWRRLSIPIFLHAGVNLTGAIVLMWGNQIVDYLDRTQSQLQSLAGLLHLG